MNKIKLFVSYAREEEVYKSELLKFLNEKDCPKISVWTDDKSGPGALWNNEIKTNLSASKIILLLLSVDFLQSDYIRENELKPALEMHEKGECIVIPIFTRSCTLDNYPEITRLNGLPKNMKFIATSGEERWEQYKTITSKVNEIANESFSKIIPVKKTTSVDVQLATKLLNDGKIFLSIPATKEGRRKREEFIYETELRHKYEDKWRYKIVPDIKTAEKLINKKEQEQKDELINYLSQCCFSINIISAEEDINEGIGKLQFDLVREMKLSSVFFKNIFWLKDDELKERLKSLPVNESDGGIFDNPYQTWNKGEELFQIVDNCENKIKVQIATGRSKSSKKRVVILINEGNSNEVNESVEELKAALEVNPNIDVLKYYSNERSMGEKAFLSQFQGAIIYYKKTPEGPWAVYKQSYLVEPDSFESTAIFLEEPDIQTKWDYFGNLTPRFRLKGELMKGVENINSQLFGKNNSNIPNQA